MLAEPRSQGPRTKSQNPKTKFQRPRAKTQNPKSKTQNPRTKTQNPKTKKQKAMVKRQVTLLARCVINDSHLTRSRFLGIWTLDFGIWTLIGLWNIGSRLRSRISTLKAAPAYCYTFVDNYSDSRRINSGFLSILVKIMIL